MKIIEYTPKDFHNLEPSWRRLETGDDMTAFQSYDWYYYINKLYFKERIKRLFRKWRYLLVLENDIPVLIAPICIISTGLFFKRGEKRYGLQRGCYFIGRCGYSDYLNFIYDEFSAEALAFVLSYLENKYKHHVCCFEQMIAETAAYQYLDQHYLSSHLPLSCAWLPLPKTFDEYRLSLSKSTRQNIRTALNRAEKNQLILTHFLTFEADSKTNELLLAIRAKRLRKKVKNANQRLSIFGRIYNGLRALLIRCFSAKHNVLQESKNTWYFLVKDNDRIVSFFWGILNPHKNELYVILAGVDEEYAWYSPSISHLYLFLQEQYSSNSYGIKVFDFTRGGEKYKKDIGCVDKPVFSLFFSLRKPKDLSAQQN